MVTFHPGASRVARRFGMVVLVFNAELQIEKLIAAGKLDAWHKAIRANDVKIQGHADPAFPSRLSGAFPHGMVPERIGLKEAVERTAAFLKP